MRIIIFLLLISSGISAQVAFRNPIGLTVIAPPPQLGVTTTYDYTVTDGIRQWHLNSYSWRVFIPAPNYRCKVYVLVKEFTGGIQTNRKMYIFYEKDN